MRPNDLAAIFSINELPDYFNKIEQRMLDLVSAKNKLIEIPMVRLIKGLNKRFAMYFVIPVARSQGKVVDDKIINCCAILELLSMAFCIHDDITDESNKRYGVPNINAVEGVNQAILIGGYLQNLAVREALAISPEIAQVIINSIDENRVSEIIEIADRYNKNRSLESYKNCISLKTASHFSASCQVGALCSDVSKSEVDVFGKYGSALGMTYQMIDDLLDIVSTEEIMNKPVGKDVEEGVYTLPILLTLNGPNGGKMKSLLSSSSKGRDVSSELIKLLMADGAIEQTIQQIRDNNNYAAKTLTGLKENAYLKGLEKFPELFLDMALEYSAIKLYS